MRFLPHGPTIPDDLLIARDEGRVVFFCGAGVSQARAGLPDFFGLADAVLRKLGVPYDHPAQKILSGAREFEEQTGVSGIISADRIFGLLEREFDVQSIESKVAEALRPCPNVDLSAHRILLNLATTLDGKVRIVTTNFDRLFEDCNNVIPVWQPPRLPDPARSIDLNGIVHLHGRANKDYNSAEGAGFVLSSSEFGRAYLSDGWAREFLRETFGRFVVVLVGYAADDPPVQYLLEALNRTTGQLNGVYAFQSGTSGEAAARWKHKGIEAIAYIENGGHLALWDTLEKWQERAKAPDDWYDSVVDLAKKGPQHLQPHERGQVAHIVSTLEGARKFSEGDIPPPADWLCVFDPDRRYAKPGHTGGFGENGPYIDPFQLYGLDSDIVPSRIDSDDPFEDREVLSTAWDAFAPNRLDRQYLRDDNFSAIRGHWAITPPRLPPRLEQLSEWIRQVAHQPASVWWAADQIALHPNIQQLLQRELGRSHKDIPPAIRQAWRYLIEAWNEQTADFDRDWLELEAVINKYGWDSAAIRKFADIYRPHLKARRNYSDGPKPPSPKEAMRIENMLCLEVEYPGPPNDITIPDQWLPLAIRQLRKNLEHALILESELGGRKLRNISPIVPDDVPGDDKFQRKHGLSGCVAHFSSLFSRLIGSDVSAAYEEFSAWPKNDDTIFSKLRIWASGKARLVSAQDFGRIIASLSDDAFWDYYHQRDLLLVLAARWKNLSKDARKRIEKRLLKGPRRWRDEKNKEFQNRRAWILLIRTNWLGNQGCEFSFNLEAETEKLRSIVPEWQPEHAKKAAGSMESRSGWVKKDTEHSLLLTEPLPSILTKALELSGRLQDFLVEQDPFAGFVAERPVRAFAALANAAKQNDYPEWAWQRFLDSKLRKDDPPKFAALIAERISRYPDAAVTALVHPVSDWLLNDGNSLASSFPQTFDRIISRFISVLRPQTPASESAIARGNKEPDWTMEAINAPVGKIAQALFKDSRKNGLKAGQGFPGKWLAHVNDLLSLPGDLRRHALVIFAHNINWFHTIDPSWTESSLLSVLDRDSEDDRSALWSGFFWSATIPNQMLFVRMKPDLLALAKAGSLSRRGHGEVLAGIILAGWGDLNLVTGERYISNDEMRDVLLQSEDEFRFHILWQAEKWADGQKREASNKWPERLLDLLRDVWPLQKSVKSPRISAKLCGLAFSSAERFSEMAKLILPHLTKINRDFRVIPNLRKSNDNIVDLYPRLTLALLHAVLPDNAAAWPYGVELTLQRIGKADPSLKLDENLLELDRIWNSR